MELEELEVMEVTVVEAEKLVVFAIIVDLNVVFEDNARRVNFIAVVLIRI